MRFEGSIVGVKLENYGVFNRLNPVRNFFFWVVLFSFDASGI